MNMKMGMKAHTEEYFMTREIIDRKTENVPPQ